MHWVQPMYKSWPCWRKWIAFVLPEKKQQLLSETSQSRPFSLVLLHGMVLNSTFSTKCPYANQVWALLWPTTQPFSILCLNFLRQGICPYAYLNLEFLILSQPLYHLGSQPMIIFIFGDKYSGFLDMKDKHGYVLCGYLWDKSAISMWLRAWVYTDTNSV